MGKRIAVKLYANEDGLGPAMGVYYIVKGLIEFFRKEASSGNRLHVRVQSESVKITRFLYAALLEERCDEPLEKDRETGFGNEDIVKVTVVRRDNVFKLGKDLRGGVNKEETQRNLQAWSEGLDDYIKMEKEDLKSFFMENEETWADQCVVISFGCPAALKAAKEADESRISRIEVFDHAWGYTLSRIFGKDRVEAPEVRAGIDRMRDMENCAQRVFLYPEYVAPSQFYSYWLGRIGSVYRIPGVFGGLPDQFVVRSDDGQPKEWQKYSTSANLENVPGVFAIETEDRSGLGLGTFLAADEAEKLSQSRDEIRQAARDWLVRQMNTWDSKFFGSPSPDFHLKRFRDAPVVVVQGGATDVWNTYIAKLIESLVQAEEDGDLDYCVLFAHVPAATAYGQYCLARKPKEKKSFQLRKGTYPGRTYNDILQLEMGNGKSQAEAEKIAEKNIMIPLGEERLKEHLKKSTKIRTLPDKYFPFFQEVYWAANMIYSRGGGVTANDAVATLTPLTIVEEVGQWQTEQIRELFRLSGFSHTVSYGTFLEGEYGIIRMYLLKTADNQEIVSKMACHPSHQELWLARQIIDL